MKSDMVGCLCPQDIIEPIIYTAVFIDPWYCILWLA